MYSLSTTRVTINLRNSVNTSLTLTVNNIKKRSEREIFFFLSPAFYIEWDHNVQLLSEAVSNWFWANSRGRPTQLQDCTLTHVNKKAVSFRSRRLAVPWRIQLPPLPLVCSADASAVCVSCCSLYIYLHPDSRQTTQLFLCLAFIFKSLPLPGSTCPVTAVKHSRTEITTIFS